MSQRPPQPDPAGTPDAREPTFLERGRVELKTLVREAMNYRVLSDTPYGLRPVLLFVVILTVASFDGRIFGQALPEIVRDLDLDVFQVLASLNLMGFFLIFLAIYLAYLADRVRRVPFVAVGAILSGVLSLVTTRQTTVWGMAVARAGDAAASTLQGTPIYSLAADYYPPQHRGKAFALFGVLGRVATLAGPLTVAALVMAATWRLPFLITGPAMILSGILAFFLLAEPVRGYMERRAMGVDEQDAQVPEEPPSIGEAWRTVWAIRTLRRLFVASIVFAIADGIYGPVFTVFLFERYGLDIMQRAWIGTAMAVVTLPFGFLAGGMVDVLIRRRPQRVLVFSGLLSLAGSIAFLAIAAGPPLAVLVGISLVFGAATALIGPARSVLFAQILPAHIRTLGGSVMVLADIPATAVRFLAFAYVFPRWGVQGALFAAVPFLFVGALIELSAAGFFERDMRSAMASQLASRDWRRAREAGRGKMLVVRSVDVEYDGVQVLFGVDIDVDDGEIVALLGTNGAGKSTLLKAISGVREASSGAVVLDGRDITHMPPHEIAGRGVSLMPGGRAVFPGLTVRENLELATWTIADAAVAKARMQEVQAMFPVLHERWTERTTLLSGGEQQMVGLAQAFLAKPRVLMIDELSLGLSPRVVGDLLDAVRRINAEGTTVILVEQSVNVALSVAQRAVFMEKGEVRFVGPTADLLSRPDILRAVYVKGTGSLATPGAVPARPDVGHATTTVLQVRNLSKSYGGVTAVHDVSLDLHEGEALGLIGPNGSGKTTLFDLISGYQQPDTGDILLDGHDIGSLQPHQRAARGLVRRFQDARLFGALSVYENLLVALDQRLAVRNVALTALQLPQARAAERRVRRRADQLIELLELGPYRDKPAAELSTGLRRIADLACVLACRPRVLLLDEPSNGIAQAEAEMLRPLLRRVRHELGCAMLVIEHDMALVSAVCDELVAMQRGSVLLQGRPDDVLDDDRVVASYLGPDAATAEQAGTAHSTEASS